MIRCRLRMAIMLLLFGTLSIAGRLNASGQTIFGPENYEIGGLHLHFSIDSFTVPESGQGTIKLTKTTPDLEILAGIIFLNDQFVSIEKFLSGEDSTLQKDISLDAENHLVVFLVGTPGASLLIEVKQEQPIPPPQVSFSADPDAIHIGEVSTLFWATEHADSVGIDQGIGTVELNGSMEVSPPETTTYSLTATGPGGVVTQDVTVTIENRLPVAHSQSLSTDEDDPIGITLTGSDSDGDSLVFSISSAPGHGTITGTPPEVTYVPNTNYFGDDSFSFRVNDGETDSEPATVIILIDPVNDPPVANNGMVTVDEDEAISITLTGSDPDGDPLTYAITSGPDHGSLSGTPPDLGYAPSADFNGTDGFTFTANDGNVDSQPATITITVNAVNDPPVANGDEVTTDKDVPVSTGNVLANDTDVDEDPLSVENFVQPLNGTVVYNGGGSFLYTPSSGFYGSDGFAYTVSDGKGGTDTATVTVTVNDITAPPSVSINAAPTTIAKGGSVTLSWSSERAESAFIDSGIGVVELSGATTVSPTHTTTYTITMTGQGGSASARTTVTVTGNPEPLPEGSFGENYQDLIPADSTVEFYDARRFSLITGLIRGTDNTPISDVSVTLHGHPEYGTAITDAEGRFTLPTEGGGTMTLVYEKSGLIAAQRKVHVPWNDIAVAETIQMIAEDPVSTTVTLDGNPGTVVTHQSTRVTDAFGSRSCSMVFQGDNRAFLVDEHGNDIHELTTLTTRATEYTAPDSMPAILPPNSAYTYCAELSADGAPRVRFEKPVITWVDNFIGFDVGEIVPVGYYDRDRGLWVPSDNGVVVKLLDTNSDGIADALDATGDDLPDDLTEDGSFTDEVTGLSDPTRYVPDTTYWRVAVRHFTPWDLNWPVGVPQDAVFPNQKGRANAFRQQPRNSDCRRPVNSFVEERSRIFHEDIPIPGTGMRLHYSANRVDGFRFQFAVPVSGDNVPPSLKGIVARIEVAGRTLEKNFDPVPDQIAQFMWDGKDILGRALNASLRAKVSVGFIYDALYYSGGNFARSFGQPGLVVTGVLARKEATLWDTDNSFILNAAKGKGTLAEGWSISAHHYVNPGDLSTLHKGDGTISRMNSSLVKCVAGNGTSGYEGDGGTAINASLSGPSSIAVDAAGNMYIADKWNDVIRKVDVNGTISTVAGGGNPPDYLGDGGPATEAMLDSPSGVEIDDTGSLYIADTRNDRIRKVDINGIITTVAGGGNPPDGFGDGGPATDAVLNDPSGIAFDKEGNLYIADTYNHCIRKMDPSGIITTVAGKVGEAGGGEIPAAASVAEGEMSSLLTVALTGIQGYSGDGGFAIGAELAAPRDVFADSWGNLFIADSGNYRIRKVDTAGIISTVAGDGTSWYSADGIPALETGLDQPYGVAVDMAGNMYIADTFNSSVRKVNSEGIISTLAGTGEMGLFTGDGGLATDARFYFVTGVAIEPSGNLLIADQQSERILKVAVPAVFADLASAGDICFADESGLGYVLDNTGRHKTTFDLNTGIVVHKFTYGVDGNLTGIIDRFGNTTAIEQDTNGVPFSIISPDGIRTSLLVDPNNLLTAVSHENGCTYHFEYSPEGLLTARVEPEGSRFEQEYDINGRLTDLKDQEGGHWQYSAEVDEAGDRRTEILTGEGDRTIYEDKRGADGVYSSIITGPSGDETRFSRSADGLKVEKHSSCGMDLTYLYSIDPWFKFNDLKEIREKSPSGLQKVTQREKVVQDRDADGIPDLTIETLTVNGETETLVTDSFEAKKTVTSSEGRIISHFYNSATLQPEIDILPGIFDTVYGYDSRGRLISVLKGTRETSYTYDERGYIASITESGNRTTSYAHDAVGRLTGMLRADGSSLGFTRDGNGNLRVLTNPKGIQHGFDYNTVNLKTIYQSPVSGSYTYIYDKDRRLKEVHFPSGFRLRNVYDKSRLIQIQTQEGNIDFTYLCGDKVGSVTNGLETITYGYDGKLLTSETLSGSLNQVLSYTYNNDFNLQNFSYAGYTFNYSYDNDGLLTDAGDFTIIRNAQNGLPESVTGNALNLARTFNGYGEVSGENYAVGGQNVTTWNLERDNNGRITRKTESVDEIASTFEYTYDPVGRLLTVTKDGVLVEEYRYDPNGTGTRIFEMNSLKGITGMDFSYSNEDHLLTAGATTYQYDADGFMLTKTFGTAVTQYEYSTRGELLSVSLSDGRTIEYLYDPLCRRTAKLINGTVVEKYLWQGLTRLLAVYDGSDNLLMRFEYADGRMPLAMTKGGNTYYLSFDQVGTLKTVADSSGNVVKRLECDSFGNIISDSNAVFEVPFTFAGGLYDKDTGLIRFGYRDYAPDIGRWTAKDPLFFEGGDTDLYGYCLNNPVAMADPDGRFRVPIAGYMTPGNDAGFPPKRISSLIFNYRIIDLNRVRAVADPCEGVISVRYGKSSFPESPAAVSSPILPGPIDPSSPWQEPQPEWIAESESPETEGSGGAAGATIGIANIEVRTIGSDRVTITWKTSQLSDSLVEYGETASYESGQQDATLTNTHSVTLTNLAPGILYHFRVASKTSMSLSESSEDHTFITASSPAEMTLTILSPQEGETVPGAQVLVKGTVTNSQGYETGVVINGICALVHGNDFAANHVPLEEGWNTITATAGDAYGNQVTDAVTAYAQIPSDFVQVKADDETGVAPFETVLRVEATFRIQGEPSITFEGPGEVEFLESPGENEYKVKLTTPGLYYFTVEVQDGSGTAYTDTTAALAMDKAALDALLRGKWNGMKEALVNGDTQCALNHFHDHAAEEYQEIFNLLGAKLPGIITGMREIECVYLEGKVVKYRIKRQEEVQGQEYDIAYYIYFTKGADGLWRIEYF